MHEYTMSELFSLTHAELLGLDHKMAVAIAELPAPSEDLTVALINQRRIRRELARRDFAPH